MSSKFIKAGTKIHLSELGQYHYYYVSDKYFVAEYDIPIIREAYSYRSSKSKDWKALVLSPEHLDKYPKRVANLIWIKGDPDEFLR